MNPQKRDIDARQLKATKMQMKNRIENEKYLLEISVNVMLVIMTG